MQMFEIPVIFIIFRTDIKVHTEEMLAILVQFEQSFETL